MASQLPTHAAGIPPLPTEGVAASPAGWGSDGIAGPSISAAARLQRLLSAVWERRWTILACTITGVTAGVVMGRLADPQYQAQTTLWMEASDRSGSSQGPIRSGQLLSSAAWIDLLKSYVVLDHVVSTERLYIDTNESEAFREFSLQDRFRPGQYRLEVNKDGKSFVLSSNGVSIQRDQITSSVGADLGFNWTPGPRVLTPGKVLEFEVLHPRDAAIGLAAELKSTLNSQGNFLRLSLTGQDPAQTARTLNALADRYTKVAAELKRDKLEQLTAVLEEQRRYAEENLREAEMELESYRVQTISLPSDAATPVAPGLEATTTTVLSRFFGFQIDREQLRSDREAIERILGEASRSVLSLDALLMVPAVQKAPALTSALQDRIQRRAELRALLQRYTPDHPSLNRLTADLQQLEEEAIPRLARELQAQILDREAELETRISSASAELQNIPPRAIEEARLARQVAIAENLHTTLKQRFEEARLAAVSTIPDIRVLDAAVVPSKPLQDAKITFVLLGLLGGLGVSVLGVVVLDRMDSRVRYPEEVTHGMGLQILGVVPYVKQTSDQEATTTFAAEAFRELRLGIFHAHGSAGPVTVTITSPGSGDGKSFVASNLAVAFADQGHRTLLIDGDIRRGTLHRNFGAQRTPGLTDYLAGSATEEEILQPTAFPNLHLIGAGTRLTNGPELLSSSNMSQLLLGLRARFTVVIVDSAPLGAGVDAYALGTLTRDLLLVVRTGATDRAFATAKLSVLDRLPVRVLGAVLNGAPTDQSLYRQYSYVAGYVAAGDETAGKALAEG